VTFAEKAGSNRKLKAAGSDRIDASQDDCRITESDFNGQA
jgi:hypothetical protein